MIDSRRAEQSRRRGDAETPEHTRHSILGDRGDVRALPGAAALPFFFCPLHTIPTLLRPQRQSISLISAPSSPPSASASPSAFCLPFCSWVVLIKHRDTAPRLVLSCTRPIIPPSIPLPEFGLVQTQLPSLKRPAICIPQLPTRPADTLSGFYPALP